MAFKPTNSHRDVRERAECVLGIEPNEHRIFKLRAKPSLAVIGSYGQVCMPEFGFLFIFSLFFGVFVEKVIYLGKLLESWANMATAFYLYVFEVHFESLHPSYPHAG